MNSKNPPDFRDGVLFAILLGFLIFLLYSFYDLATHGPEARQQDLYDYFNNGYNQGLDKGFSEGYEHGRWYQNQICEYFFGEIPRPFLNITYEEVEDYEPEIKECNLELRSDGYKKECWYEKR